MLGTQSGFSSLGESSQAKRCKCWQSEVHQCALKWKGLRMWAGYQQHPLCSLKTKQNKTFSPPPGFPISLNVPPFTQLLMLKTLQFSLIRFLVLFCFVCVCSCRTFSLSPNPVNSIFKIYLNPTTSHHLHHHLSLDFFYSFLV